MKKRLTQSEEFEIMKLVLDKFLWLGFGIMAFGLYRLIQGGTDSVVSGFSFIVGGAVILVIFMIIIVKEYEIIA
ncbi:hypothetical protein GOV08_00720 [Candidatus Woesearchaeota archaeon]|nr:hypothetical protein [Candidatus Woesearchaeota archaeon]